MTCYLDSKSSPSAECSSTSKYTGKCITHDTAFVRTVGNLCKCVARLAIVKEDLGIRADTAKHISRRRVSDVLDELGVSLDGLYSILCKSERV